MTTKQLLREWLLVDMFFLTVFLIAIIPGKNKELIVQLLYVDLSITVSSQQSIAVFE